MQHHQSAQELYSELCHQLVTLTAQDKGAEGASVHVLNTLGACFMHMVSTSVQAFTSGDHDSRLMYLTLAVVAMLGSCTELIKVAPAYGQFNITLPGDYDMPTCTALNCHLMLQCVVPCCAALQCVCPCHSELCST